jgi:tetraacyldisaccharide 4'-kinase
MAGDEALVISRNLPQAIVAVGKDRAEVGKKIEQAFDVNLHLLDDGFQHLRLSRSFNLLLIDTTDPFGGGHLLPRGRLREPLLGASRADAVVFTRATEGQDYSSLLDCLREVNPQLPCFKVRQTLIFGNEQGSAASNSAIPLAGTRVLAFAGIANPGQFFGSLRAQGFELVDGLRFRDHHRYTMRDLEMIKRKCREMDVQIAVTTEKDRENLGHLTLDPLRLLVVKVVFEFDQPMRLLELIRKKTSPIAE